MKPTPSIANSGTPEPKNKKTHRFRNGLLWFFSLWLVFVVLMVLGYNYLQERRLQGLLDDYRERGEPLSYSEAYAMLTANPPPDELNLAKVPLLLALHPSDEGRKARAQLEWERPDLLEFRERLRDMPTPPLFPVDSNSLQRAEPDWELWDPDHPDWAMAMDLTDWAWEHHEDSAAASVYHNTQWMHPLIHELADDVRERSAVLWPRIDVADEDFMMSGMAHLPETNLLLVVGRKAQSIALAAIDKGDTALAVSVVELQAGLARISLDHGLMIHGFVAATGWIYTDCVIYNAIIGQVWNDSELERIQHAIEITLPVARWEPVVRMERTATAVLKRHHLRGVVSDWQDAVLRLLPRGVYTAATTGVLSELDHEFLRSDKHLPQEAPPFTLEPLILDVPADPYGRPAIRSLGLNRTDNKGVQATLDGRPDDRGADGDIVWSYEPFVE